MQFLQPYMQRGIRSTDLAWNDANYYIPVDPEIITRLIGHLFDHHYDFTVSETMITSFFNKFILYFRQKIPQIKYYELGIENFQSYRTDRQITKEHAENLFTRNINGSGLRQEFTTWYRTIYYKNGDVFRWANNMKETGTMTYADGGVYEGMLNLESFEPIFGVMNTAVGPPHDLIDGLKVLDIIDNVPAPDFLANRNTFIIVNSLGEQYRHIGINMSAVIKKLFVECKDDTPPSGLGTMDYPEYIKEETKDNLYMKMPINDGAIIMVQLPIILTGTRFCKLVQLRPIFKFMDIDLIKGKQISLMGADHCNQTDRQWVYRLVELEADQLTEIITTTKAQSHLQEKEETEAATKEAEIIAERGQAILIRYNNNQDVVIPYSTSPEITTIGWVKEQFRSLIPEELRNKTIIFLYAGRILRDEEFISILRENTVISAILRSPPAAEEDARGFNNHIKSKKHNRRRTKKHRNRRNMRTKRHYKRFKMMRK